MEREPIVHALLYGLPLCGFSSRTPGNWPEGHMWVGVKDVERISCPRCKEEALEINQKTE